MSAVRPHTSPAPAFAADLRRFGDAPALVDHDASFTYAELADRVDDARAELDGERRLVLIVAHNRIETAIWHLACLAGRHVPLLLPAEQPERLGAWIDRLDPDVVIDVARTPAVLERHPGGTHDLHPDLALLLATSGSTGAPRLVRLSTINLDANAASIAASLPMRPDDCAMLSLPLAYTYGLSILHSNLLIGARVALTDASVVDGAFWRLFRAVGATALAGVPHTYELLAHAGDGWQTEPGLRYATQAGGRLDPERVRALAEAGRRHGWSFHVMYGQTEATARMAVLPPDLAASHPTSIGRPIAGGTFRIDPAPDVLPPDDGGELVYSGPNVMMGYAERPADLARGAELDELRTGDLARIGPEGLVEVIGRRAAFAKVLGLRIDLDHLERLLADYGFEALCLEHEGRLGVIVVGDAERARRAAADGTGLPLTRVTAVAVDEVPRGAAGKPDRGAARRLLAAQPDPATPHSVRAAMQRGLGVREIADDATFAGLGGDSLTYVEVAADLELALGRLPATWPLMTVAELEALEPIVPPRPSRWRTLETGIALRALAIVVIVGTHVGLFTIRGGAHLLIAIVGYNIARFQLADAARRDRTRRLLAGAARIAVPSMALIGLLALVFHRPGLSPHNVLLINHLVGEDALGPAWRYWFIEAVVAITLAVTVLLAIPGVARIDRRRPLALPLALTTIGIAVRWLGAPIAPEMRNYTPLFVLWLFALGWLIARSSTTRDRLVATALGAIGLAGFFDSALRTAIVAIGLAALIWLPHVRVPARVIPLITLIAASSLMVYLTHWTVNLAAHPLGPLVSLVACFAVGALLWRFVTATPSTVTALLASARRIAHRPSTNPEGST